MSKIDHPLLGSFIFVHSMLDDAGLSANEFRVYAHIARRAGGGMAFPAVASIADVCRIHKDTVWAVLRSLEERGMVVRIARTGASNVYRLTDPKAWTHPSDSATGKEGAPEMEGWGAPENKGCPPPETEGHEGTPHKEIQRRTSTTRNEAESIYQAYPRKVGKLAALKAIEKALKVSDAAVILATIRRSLSALEASGLIARIDRFQDNVQRACGYVLMHPENGTRLPWIVDDANRNTGFFHALRVGGALCEGTLANGGEGAHSARGEGAQKRNPEQEGSFHDECDKSGTSVIEPKKRSIFSPPTESEWVGYCRSTWADWHTSADAWAHYQAVGWVAGKAKIKDWKAAARTSHSRAKEWGKLGQPTNEHDEFWRNFKR